MRRDAAAAARELVADVDDAGGEVDVVPAEREHFGEAHAGVRPGEKQRLVSARAGGEKTSELGLGEDALIGAQRTRPLVPLKPMERMRRDIAAAEREGEDTAERTEDPLDRPRRQTLRLQLARDRDDVVGRDQRQPASAKPGQQVVVQLRAVEIDRPIAPFARSDLGLELSEPAIRDLCKGQPW